MYDINHELAALLSKMPDLDKAQAALVRERVIRNVMRDSGEERQHVADMLDAMESMGQESVLELTEGEPTTLRDALQRYVESLEAADTPEEHAGAIDDLSAILAYPFPAPELDMVDDGHVMKISVGGSVLLTVDREDNTLSSVSDAVEAVHKALTSRN